MNSQATTGLKARDIELQAVTLDPADRFHITLRLLIGSPSLLPQTALASDGAPAIGHRVTLEPVFTQRSRLELQSAASPGGSR